MSEFGILIVGKAGHGAIFSSVLLAEAAFLSRKHVAQTSKTGAGVRNGNVEAHVIISDEPIYFPYITEPDVLISLSNNPIDKHINSIRSDGLVLTDGCENKIVKNLGYVHFSLNCKAELMRENISEEQTNILMLAAAVTLCDIVNVNGLLEAAKTIDQFNQKEIIKSLLLGVELAQQCKSSCL